MNICSRRQAIATENTRRLKDDKSKKGINKHNKIVGLIEICDPPVYSCLFEDDKVKVFLCERCYIELYPSLLKKGGVITKL